MSDAWDIASLFLRILAIAAVIAGVALPILDAVGVKLVTFSRGRLVAVALGFVTTALVLGAVDYAVNRNETQKRPSATETPGGSSFKVTTGDNSGSHNRIEQRFGSITFAPGESPEERARKKQQAGQMVVEEILGAFTALDHRLGFIDSTLTSDPFVAQFRAANERLTPAASQTWGSGYRALIAQQRAGSLRGDFNSQPPHTDLREPLLRQMQEVQVDPSAARNFYDALTSVADKSEDLLSIVADPESSDEASIAGHRLVLQRKTVRTASEVAYLRGLAVLIGLGLGNDPSVAAQLHRLQRLDPRYVPGPAELKHLMQSTVEEAAGVVAEKAALLEKARPLPEQDLKRLQAEAEESVRVKPDDPWNVVVGKARSLRDFGRTEDTVKAYATYAEMFAATDPTAEQYSRTAQSFTRALGHLHVKGGVYIYALENAGGRRAGLMEGDIIIEYAGQRVSDAVEFQKAFQEHPPTAGDVLTFVRLVGDGSFVKGTATLAEPTLGISVMPI